tara:strand:+ start:2707 stop:3438 length:732 start_codon:yes stop_codon:yes gene_type:complete
MKKINEVYETYDYSLFDFLPTNRDVDKNHVKRIKKSMLKRRLLTPIIINEKGQIIDGQHRYVAQKSLNMSIPYVVEKGYGVDEAKILNLIQQNWNIEAWVTHYCRHNNDNYIAYRKFKSKYGFESAQCIYILTQGNPITAMSFKAGNFKVGSLDAAYEYADKILSLKPYCEEYNRRYFVRAMITCFKRTSSEFSAAYSHDHFLYKLSKQNNSLEKCVDKEHYLKLIQKIYNHKTIKSKKIRLY